MLLLWRSEKNRKERKEEEEKNAKKEISKDREWKVVHDKVCYREKRREDGSGGGKGEEKCECSMNTE